MSNDNNYFLQRKVKVLLKIDEILKKLPHFVTEYFVGIENNSSPLTRLNYAVDLQIFFDYVLNKYDYESVTSIPLSVLDKITASDIEHF